MNNRYLSLLEQMTLEQLQHEASQHTEKRPDIAALAYEAMMEKVDDFDEKLRYQEIATLFELRSQLPQFHHDDKIAQVL